MPACATMSFACEGHAVFCFGNLMAVPIGGVGITERREWSHLGGWEMHSEEGCPSASDL